MNYLQPKKVYNRMGWFFCILYAVMLYVQVLASILGYLVDRTLLEDINFLMVLNIVSYYGTAFPIFAFCMTTLEGRPERKKERLGLKRFVVLFFIAFAIMNLSNLLNVGFSAFFQLVTGVTLEGELDDILGKPSILTAVTTVVLAPVFEELTFRSIALSKLKKYGDKTAILVTAVLFALFHMNFEQAIYAFCVGCVLGYVMCMTGRVEYCIAIHMMVNFLGGAVPMVLEYLKNPVLEGAWGVLYINMLLVGTVLLVICRKRIKLEPAKEYVPNPVGSFLGNPGMLFFIITSGIIMTVSFAMKVFRALF